MMQSFAHALACMRKVSQVCLVRLTHRKIWREFQISEARGFAFLGNVNALSQAFLRGAGLLTTQTRHRTLILALGFQNIV